MTHPYKKVTCWETPDLPADHTERRAYMVLFRALQMQDDYWPTAAFGEEITLLIERGHAEAHGKGYRLTDAGRAFDTGACSTGRYAAGVLFINFGKPDV